MKPFNQFDMEQQIMTCWNVCEDLQTLNEGVLDRGMSTDSISNVLMGMKDLYQLKFETLFEQFESMCREFYKLKNPEQPRTSYMGYGDTDEDDNMNARGEIL